MIVAPLLLAAFAFLAVRCLRRRRHAAGDIVLNETGSTLLYPLFQRWIPDYRRHARTSKITVGGHRFGRRHRKAIAGTVQIGASDAYMSDEMRAVTAKSSISRWRFPRRRSTTILPGLAAPPEARRTDARRHLFRRDREWDAPAIAALNPGVTLPHHGSFRSVAKTPPATPSCSPSSSISRRQAGKTQSATAPASSGRMSPGSAAATGNDGMVHGLAATPYSIGYVGISFRDEIAKAGLGTAMLKNQSGKFVLPTPETISAAAVDARPAHAGRRAPQPGLCAGRRLLSAGQLRICDRVDQTQPDR